MDRTEEQALMDANQRVNLAFRRQLNSHLASLDSDDPLVGYQKIISKHTQNYADGTMYAIALWENSATGMRGVAEWHGETKHFPQRCRTKRAAGVAVAEDDDIMDEDQEMRDDGTNTRQRRSGAVNLNIQERTAGDFIAAGSTSRAGRASASKRTKPNASAAAASNSYRRTKTSNTRAKRSSAGSTRRSQTSRPRRRNTPVEGAVAARVDVNGEPEDQGYETARPQSSSARVLRSSTRRASRTPMVKSETDDLEHLLSNFDIASVAGSESTMVFSRAGSVMSSFSVGGLPSTSTMTL